MTPAEMKARMELVERHLCELQFWARRYADGRKTYAADAVNEIAQYMIARRNQPMPDNGVVWASDGVFGPPTALIEKYGLDGRKGQA